MSSYDSIPFHPIEIQLIPRHLLFWILGSFSISGILIWQGSELTKVIIFLCDELALITSRYIWSCSDMHKWCRQGWKVTKWNSFFGKWGECKRERGKIEWGGEQHERELTFLWRKGYIEVKETVVPHWSSPRTEQEKKFSYVRWYSLFHRWGQSWQRKRSGQISYAHDRIPNENWAMLYSLSFSLAT